MDAHTPEVSVVLPCRNESEALESCIESIAKVFKEHGIDGEVIVSDSSTDDSPRIAERLGAMLVKHDREGYGIACLEGFRAARGRFIFLADADGSYDFAEIPSFIEPLRCGCDFVIGNRFAGSIEDGAMPWHHRLIGNPLLSLMLNVFFGSSVRDVHCGMRAIRKEALERLDLRTSGMEFASEMVVAVKKKKLKTKEVPVNYHLRKGESKMRSFADGWRHLRFMLLYSPLFLFLIPGALLFITGFLSMTWLYVGSPEISGIRFFYHPMFISSLLLITGYQLAIFSLFAKTYAINHLGDGDELMRQAYKHLTIENAIFSGCILSFSGAFIYSDIIFKWFVSGFGALDEIKSSIVALTLVVMGIQTIFSSFMLSMLGIKEK